MPATEAPVSSPARTIGPAGQVTSGLPPISFPPRRLDVRDFGARGDGTGNDSPAFGAAIAACHGSGGGTVFVPSGRYPAASVRLLSNVRLELHPDAEIFGAGGGAFELPRPYPGDVYQDVGMSYPELAILYGEEIENVEITGGRINGGSITRHDPKPNEGNKTIAIRNGRGLRFHGLVHESGGHFVYNLMGCEDVELRDVIIGMPRGETANLPDGNMVLRNRDAISLVSCKHVRVFDCAFTASGDDTIGIKNHFGLGREGACEDIRVWDTVLETGCNAIQIGSETAGDFTNLHFENITIRRAMKAALGITSNDGGHIRDVTFRNISVTGAATPIFVAVTDRMRTGATGKTPGSIRDVTFENISFEDFRGGWHGGTHPLTITGHPASPIQGLHFGNLQIRYAGGPPQPAPNHELAYTKRYSPDLIGRRPASAFYLRDARNIRFEEVRIAWDEPDPRPHLVARNCRDVRFDRVRIAAHPGQAEMVLDAVQGMTVTACQPWEEMRNRDWPTLDTPYVWRGENESPGQPQPGQSFDLNLVEKRFAMRFVWINPGAFLQGSPPGERGRDADETQREVTISHGFWMAAHEVTQRQWFALMGCNPSRFQTDPELPVHNVSWHDAIAFCRRLNAREHAAGRLPEGWHYTLPTEAQWEFACRAGTTSPTSGDLWQVAWFDLNTVQRPIGASPMPVGLKCPNAWGLHDLHGNVREWCLDGYEPYTQGPVTDPAGPDNAPRRVLRGGGWRDGNQALRSACRMSLPPDAAMHDLGFRVVLSKAS